MRRKTAIFFFLTVIFMTLSGIVPVCYADTEKGDTTMEQLVITLDRMHNRCFAKWEKPSVSGGGEYTAILEAVDESGNEKEAIRTTIPLTRITTWRMRARRTDSRTGCA